MRQPAADFWRSTPARVSAFVEHHQASERALDARAGIIATLLANANRAKGMRPARPQDFFPSLAPKGVALVMSADDMRAGVLRHFGRG